MYPAAVPRLQVGRSKAKGILYCDMAPWPNNSHERGHVGAFAPCLMATDSGRP